MLLTSGQISVAISSSVIFTFTTLLFLSGYVLQQQTVRSLQAAIHPHLPPPPPVTNPVLAKHFGTPPGHSFYDKFLASNRPKGGWAKAAYVQLVRRPHEVCGAVMGMRELHVGESMAQRIIIYPREWDRTLETGESRDASVETSRRLLRKAAKEFKVMLQPVNEVAQVKKGVNLADEERYPLTNLLSLINYNRILLLHQPALILDSTPLDLLFTLPMEKPMLGLSDPQDEGREPAILLFEPTREMYQEVTATLPEGAYPDAEFLQKVHVEHAPEDPEHHVHLLATTGLLDNEGSGINATDFFEMTAYVHLSDPALPGPEYDIPRQDFMKAMPGFREARGVWESVYERFRDARMNVCGLDLEPIETHEVLVETELKMS